MSADQNSALVKVLAPALAESEVGRLATQAILTDVIGTIGEYLGQCFVGDAAGASEAMAALRVAVQPLAKAIDSRELLLAQLREAVRVQDLEIELQLVDPRRISVVTETLENYPVPSIPSEGFVLQLPDRRLAVVTRPPRFVGRATIIQAKVWGHQPESDRF